VIHFAALKAVGESCQKPLMYYKNNISGAMSLLTVCSVSYYHHLTRTDNDSDTDTEFYYTLVAD